MSVHIFNRCAEGASRGRPRRGPATLIASRASSGTRSRRRATAKRLLPQARAAGYEGSARHFRRAVARVKARWARSEHNRRPWAPSPGEHLVIDWGEEGPLKIFCAVLAWSRSRFVRFATDMKRETTLRLLTECIEELGAVPHVVVSDRMGCLRAQTVANVVVSHPDYVRFATHFSFRPDFCEAGDPESKGVVEALVGYAKSDLVVPSEGWDDLEHANLDAKTWCHEVNARMHSEISAVPTERLAEELFAVGLFYSAVTPSTNSGVLAWASGAFGMRAMALKQMGVTAGTTIAAAVIPPLVVWLGWRSGVIVWGATWCRSGWPPCCSCWFSTACRPTSSSPCRTRGLPCSLPEPR